MKYLIFLPITLLSFGVAFGSYNYYDSSTKREGACTDCNCCQGLTNGREAYACSTELWCN